MALFQDMDGIYAKRFSGFVSAAGPLAAANFALSGGFGSTATVSAVQAGSTDTRFNITITSAGTGQGANPTCTLTFKDGGYADHTRAAVIPVAVACRSGGSQPSVPFSTSCTATALTLTFVGTPVAAETYSLSVHVLG